MYQLHSTVSICSVDTSRIIIMLLIIITIPEAYNSCQQHLTPVDHDKTTTKNKTKQSQSTVEGASVSKKLTLRS